MALDLPVKGGRIEEAVLIIVTKSMPSEGHVLTVCLGGVISYGLTLKAVENPILSIFLFDLDVWVFVFSSTSSNPKLADI